MGSVLGSETLSERVTTPADKHGVAAKSDTVTNVSSDDAIHQGVPRFSTSMHLCIICSHSFYSFSEIFSLFTWAGRGPKARNGLHGGESGHGCPPLCPEFANPFRTRTMSSSAVVRPTAGPARFRGQGCLCAAHGGSERSDRYNCL